MTTHDPLTIAGLRADQVTVLSNDAEDGSIRAAKPPVDPKGLGVSSILTQIFGMRTTLDPETQEDLDNRNLLLTIDNRTKEQADKLAELNERLKLLGFLIESREPEYEAFLRAYVAEREVREVYTPEQIAAQNQLARQILRNLREKRRPH